MGNLFSNIGDKIFTTIEDIEIRFQNVISNTPVVFKIIIKIFFIILKILMGIFLLMTVVLGSLLGSLLGLLLFLTINLVINKFFVTAITILISILLSIIVFNDLYKYSKKSKVESINQDLIEILQLAKYILLILLTLHCILKSLDIELN